MGKILKAIKDCNIESIIKIQNNICTISAWYLIFAFYPMFRVDNPVIKSLVFITLSLLTLLWIVLYISILIKYKGSLMELLQRKIGWFDALNSFLWIAVMVYQCFFCPNEYRIIVAYAALTMMVINCVIFVFDNSYESKNNANGDK